MNMNTRYSGHGFTLIELLVVISIVALLIAILVPSLARSKEQTRRVVCQSFLHQFTLITNVYASDFKNNLPSFTASSGPHVHDISLEFMEYLQLKYGLETEHFFCPSIPMSRVEKAMGKTWPSHKVISYDYWVPRMVTVYGVDIPPKESKGALVVIDNSDYQGPRKTTDSCIGKNPVVTDNMGAPETFLPPQKLGQYRNPDITNALQSHHWSGRLEISNQGFVDGHVDKAKADTMTPRYGYGNGYIWR